MPFVGTGGPQIVLFLRPKRTVLLRKPYYFGTDLVLKSRFMTFGFSKSPFFAHFQAIFTFEAKKVRVMVIWVVFQGMDTKYLAKNHRSQRNILYFVK